MVAEPEQFAGVHLSHFAGAISGLPLWKTGVSLIKLLGAYLGA